MKELLSKLEATIEKADQILDESDRGLIKLFAGFGKEVAEKWSRAYINSLPDSAFIFIEPGYKEGMNKNARHLPYKNKEGKVDIPHLKNALARCSLIKPVLGTISAEEARKKACAKAKQIAKKYLKTYQK
ncbi:MAG TPA: hypothetical protein ENL09_02320 [Bacteroidetes bacterium]|nr:hypothetical protein [Bacteroidota bacterium]